MSRKQLKQVSHVRDMDEVPLLPQGNFHNKDEVPHLFQGKGEVPQKISGKRMSKI